MRKAVLTPFQHKLPSSGPEREALREKGQFWTPDWVAQAMVAYATGNGSGQVFDPAVGAGAFFRAAKAIADEAKRPVGFDLLGVEIDADALMVALETGLTEADLRGVRIADFVLDPPRRRFKTIVGNPPYVRHHRLSNDVKAALKKLAASSVGVALDGRAGLHVYFLIRALQLLQPEGRLALIMPADTCEGVFARPLWKWIADNYRIDAVVSFAPDASPFPKVDTNPLIFMISESLPMPEFLWIRCNTAGTCALKDWTLSGMQDRGYEALTIQKRQIDEALRTGLSRPPVEVEHTGPILADFAHVTRGIATGANEFFVLTRQQAADLGLPKEFLLPVVGRTRDVESDVVSDERLNELDSAGRPTLLLSLPGQPMKSFPPVLQKYLRFGEELGIHRRTLIATRRPWYKMEIREVPPILFAYLGRRNARFIRNLAGAMPLTGFLCVFPHHSDPEYVEMLWRAVSHPDTLANLHLVGKSYGAGAIKVEPRALDRLPIPARVAREVGLVPSQRSIVSVQMSFLME